MSRARCVVLAHPLCRRKSIPLLEMVPTELSATASVENQETGALPTEPFSNASTKIRERVIASDRSSDLRR